MLEAVGTQGYEQTTVQDAIAAAGLYRQAFYDSFEDKEDCYLQALDAGSAWVELAMREAAAGETTWRDQLRGALGGLLALPRRAAGDRPGAAGRGSCRRADGRWGSGQRRWSGRRR